ncbi:hypothetical protein K438DRAFT_517817 [Mycena galopus ATCC 62051]|nr:hypothetical protein K438DRAFT_517817 [Mycena galopus ATCC 62051]
MATWYPEGYGSHQKYYYPPGPPALSAATSNPNPLPGAAISHRVETTPVLPPQIRIHLPGAATSPRAETTIPTVAKQAPRVKHRFPLCMAATPIQATHSLTLWTAWTIS